MKRKRTILKVLILLVLALPLGILLFIQTPPGKALTARAVTTMLSRSENLSVRIGTLSGWIPGEVSISEVEIADAEGVWLQARNLHFRWILRALFDELILLDEIGADEVVMLRRPLASKTAMTKKDSSIHSEPVELQLNDLHVEKLRLKEEVAGVALEYSVHSGGVRYQTTGRMNGVLAVSGDADGRVALDALLAGTSADYLMIDAELERMHHPAFGLDYISGQARATVKASGVQADVAAEIQKDGAVGTFEGQLEFADRLLRFSEVGVAVPGYACAGEGTLLFSNGTVGVAFDSFILDAATNRYAVGAEAVVAVSNKTWAVDVVRLEVEGWETLGFTLEGRVEPAAIRLAGALREFDIEKLPLAGMSNFTGKVNGRVTVDGSLEKPKVVAAVVVNQFTSVQDAFDELPELDFRIAGGLADGRFFASTVLTNYSMGRFSGSLAMPCEFSLEPLVLRPAVSNLSLTVGANLDLSIFNQLAMFENQLIEGMLDTRVQYRDGRPDGYLRIADGRYEHYDLGVVFRNFNAELEATPQGFTVKQALATDGETGTLAVTGGLGKSGLDLALVLNRAGIIQRDEVEAQISGNLQVKGRLSRPDVSGTVIIDRAEILLDNIAAAPPVLLTDFDAGDPTNRVVLVREQNPPPVGLDIAVNLPDQVFVIASMIEATLGGNLHITDAPNGVSVKGKIEPRRGFVNFIGKKFRFTQGNILLDGSVPASAVLDNLTSEYSRRDVTARLVLNGNATDPSFRLESSPPLPQDEILSHVLFNRDTSSISPYQAYQIAAAARQLSGGLNGPGFMYQVRRAIGVDTLEIREADAAGEASSVAAGKYLTSGLYVEVNQSLDARGQTGMMAEFEVTRHFSVETYTGPKMRPGIGVNWRNDY
jgi:autotransporter translocation and assembly factor TamB